VIIKKFSCFWGYRPAFQIFIEKIETPPPGSRQISSAQSACVPVITETPTPQPDV
jgi:hypothetical protein